MRARLFNDNNSMSANLFIFPCLVLEQQASNMRSNLPHPQSNTNGKFNYAGRNGRTSWDYLVPAEKQSYKTRMTNVNNWKTKKKTQNKKQEPKIRRRRRESREKPNKHRKRIGGRYTGSDERRGKDDVAKKDQCRTQDLVLRILLID